jgi:hypothetical protein
MSWAALDRRRLADLPIAAAFAAAAITARVSIGPLTIDDAYVTFRYARNVATGVGFVYNAGEHVLGTTTPLWTLVLAGAYLLGGHDLSGVALAISALADAGTAVVLYFLSRAFGWPREWGAILAGLFAVSPYSIAFAASGMESSLFGFLVVLAAFAISRGRYGLAAVSVALATLARPEGIILAALALVQYVWRGRAVPWRPAATFLAILLPWCLFATWQFGSFLPQSVLAKGAGHDSSALANAAWFLNQLGRPGLNALALPTESPRVRLGIALSAVILFAVLLQRRRVAAYLSGHRMYLTLALFAPLLVGAYVAAGVRGVQMFHWYLVPLVPFYLIGIVGSLRAATARLARRGAWVAAPILFAWTLAGSNLADDPGLPAWAPLGATNAVERAYMSAGHDLSQPIPEMRVAAPDIGALGYVSNVRILDTFGLISPESARYYPLPPGAPYAEIPPDLIRDQQPDLIVSLDLWLSPGLLDAKWFQSNYRLVERVDVPDHRMWSGRSVVVYERVRGPP